MATLGAITQLPKEFFMHAVTLAGAATETPLSPEQVESNAAQLADASAGSALTAERYAYSRRSLLVAQHTRAIHNGILGCSEREDHPGESGHTCVTCGVGMKCDEPIAHDKLNLLGHINRLCERQAQPVAHLTVRQSSVYTSKVTGTASISS